MALRKCWHDSSLWVLCIPTKPRDVKITALGRAQTFALSSLLRTLNCY